MKRSKLLVILSRKSGSGRDVRGEIEKVLAVHNADADIHSVDTPPQAVKLLQRTDYKYDAVVVYGGDGTVTDVIKALTKRQTKLIILPGGTGNLIAKYLRLPSDPTRLLDMYLSGTYSSVYYDVASTGTGLLTLDIHMGWLAESTLATDRGLKKRIGLLAYAVKAFSKLPKQPKHVYRYRIDDGHEYETWAYSSLFANKAIQNFFGFKLFNKHDRPSTIEIAFMLSLNPLRFLAWMIGRVISGRNLGGFLRVHYCYKVEMLQGPSMMLFDDEEMNIKYPLAIKAGSGAVKILTPPEIPKTGILLAARSKVRHIWYVVVEQIRNTVFGTPLYRYSQVLPGLYLGGNIHPRAKKEFRSWGVGAIVNMRRTPDEGFGEFDQLHLATKDLYPPSLSMLSRGVKFITKHIDSGRGVYVHCRHGRGRGPTMVAAYLIAKHGMTTDEALKHLSMVRPMTELLTRQKKRLLEFETSMNKQQNTKHRERQ